MFQAPARRMKPNNLVNHPVGTLVYLSIANALYCYSPQHWLESPFAALALAHEMQMSMDLVLVERAIQLIRAEIISWYVFIVPTHKSLDKVHERNKY